METYNDYEQRLAQSGLKKTKHRKAILFVMQKSKQPIAAEDVYFALKEQDISINLSTVYRTLEVLSDKGLLTKLSISGDSRSLYEYNRMVHRHYLICMGCKKIEVIDDCPLKGYEETLAGKTHYTIAGHRLDIYGYCPECKKKGRMNDKS